MAFERVVEDKDSGMAESLLDKLPHLKTGNTAAAIKAIQSLPPGEPGSDYSLQRREALRSLAKVSPIP